MLFFYYRFYKRGMDKRGGNGHDAFNGDYHTTVVTNTDKLAFDPCKDATGDADTSTFANGQLGRLKVEYGLIVITGNGHETAHLRVGDDNRAMAFAVHDIADRKQNAARLLDGINPATGSTDKDQVVNGRDQLSHAPAGLHDVLVAHWNKILYILGIEIFLQGKLATIGNTQGIPMDVS